MASNGVTRPPALDVTMQEILDALKAVSFRPQVIDNLTSQDSGAPLSANQGRVLKDAIDDLVTQSITDGDTSHAPSGDAVHDALNAISTISPISDLSTYVTDTSISSVHNFNAYKTANIISIMIDVTISDTSLHTILVPNTVLPPPKNSIMAMASVDFGSDSTTSEYAIIYGGGGNTNIRLRVHANGGRIMASVTYLY